MAGNSSSVSARFDQAMARFDAANAQDPNRERVGGVEQPHELLYAQRLSAWVARLCPSASEELRLAARAQHLCRWEIPRASYPPGRVGYLKWREDLKQLHATKAGQILRELGYPEGSIHRVQQLIQKKLFPKDPESRALEDALCLLFLETQFASTIAKTGEEKMGDILQKTWRKMSPQAHQIALGAAMTPDCRALVEKALAQTR